MHLKRGKKTTFLGLQMVTKPTHFEPTGIAWDRMQSYVFKLSAFKTCFNFRKPIIMPSERAAQTIEK